MFKLQRDVEVLQPHISDIWSELGPVSCGDRRKSHEVKVVNRMEEQTPDWFVVLVLICVHARAHAGYSTKLSLPGRGWYD